MKNIIGAILNTPWWVFPLLGYLIILGIQALQTRIVSLYKIFAIPLVFLCFSIYTLLTTAIDYIVISSWTATILLGSVAGFYQLTRLDVKVDTKHFLIQLPGSWSTLIVMLLIFSLKYFFGYDLAVNPHHAELMEYKLSMFAVSGLLTGFLQGRLIGYLYRFKNGANFNLGTKKTIT